MSLRPDSMLHVQRGTEVTFNHLCTIQRDANDDQTGWNGGEDWQPLHEDLPCEYWVESETERVQPGIAEVVRIERMVVPYGTDVKAREQGVEIRDRFGTIVSSLAHNITGVIPRLDEFEVQLGVAEVVGNADEL